MSPQGSRRSATISFVPSGQDDKIVRFIGRTFRDLKERLHEAQVPGLDGKCYLEVFIPDENCFVCLLDDDELPQGDVKARITSIEEGSRARRSDSEPVTTGRTSRSADRRKERKAREEAEDKMMQGRIMKMAEKQRQKKDALEREGHTRYGSAPREREQTVGFGLRERKSEEGEGLFRGRSLGSRPPHTLFQEMFASRQPRDPLEVAQPNTPSQIHAWRGNSAPDPAAQNLYTLHP